MSVTPHPVFGRGEPAAGGADSLPKEKFGKNSVAERNLRAFLDVEVAARAS